MNNDGLWVEYFFIGIGADKRSIDNWLDNTNAFTALLESLNEQITDNTTTAEANSSKNESKEVSSSSNGTLGRRGTSPAPPQQPSSFGRLAYVFFSKSL